MPKTFIAHFELPISPENEGLIQILAHEFGWLPGMEITPEEAIANYFTDFFDKTSKRVEYGLLKAKGELALSEIDAIMEQYHNALLTSSGFSNES